jgi:hypothetical protein
VVLCYVKLHAGDLYACVDVPQPCLSEYQCECLEADTGVSTRYDLCVGYCEEERDANGNVTLLVAVCPDG